eukprot:4789839-Prymnesium_polylepis.1
MQKAGMATRGLLGATREREAVLARPRPDLSERKGAARCRRGQGPPHRPYGGAPWIRAGARARTVQAGSMSRWAERARYSPHQAEPPNRGEPRPAAGAKSEEPSPCPSDGCPASSASAPAVLPPRLWSDFEGRSSPAVAGQRRSARRRPSEECQKVALPLRSGGGAI